MDIIQPSYWNIQKKKWCKHISTGTSYFCIDHTPKQKADAIWLLIHRVDPHKKSRFENIIK